jgi:hypothetical protein
MTKTSQEPGSAELRAGVLATAGGNQAAQADLAWDHPCIVRVADYDVKEAAA